MNAIEGRDIDRKGSVWQILPVAAINIDHDRYQRDLKQSNIDRLVREWDDDKLLPLLVNQREDGTFWCFDGQHRRAAAIQAGRKALPCLVWQGLTIEREAQLFAYFNSRASNKAVSFAEQFRARIEAHDPDALAVVRAMRRAGFGAEYHLRSRSDDIAAINACYFVYKRIGEDGLYRALDLLNRAWPNERARLTAAFIGGAAELLDKYGHRIDTRDMDRFVAKLNTVPIGEVLTKARDRQRLQRENMRSAIATVLAIQHDRKIRNENKLLGNNHE